MTMKVAVSVTRCTECPNRRYGSGGVYDCAKMDFAPLPADSVMPEWCPLPDHPGPICARAMHALANARLVLERAQGEGQQADERRLRELINIAAEQVARI